MSTFRRRIPNWRYQCLYSPVKFGFEKNLTRIVDKRSVPNSGRLRRYIRGLTFSVEYKPPYSYIDDLPYDLGRKLMEIYTDDYRKTYRHKVVCLPSVGGNDLVSWNIGSLEGIQDIFLRRAIEHISNYRFDEYIDKAISIYTDESYVNDLKIIGCSLFCGVSDIVLAKRWVLPIKTIEALRMLFFDFSAMPKDRMAMFAYTRQLEDISPIYDFSYYKRAYDLGELGVRMQVDYFNLDNDEKSEVDRYLGSSVISNALSLQFSIESKQDALKYQSVGMGLTNYYSKRHESELMRARIRNLDVQTDRVNALMNPEDTDELSSDDEEAMKFLKEMSFTDYDNRERLSIGDLK